MVAVGKFVFKPPTYQRNKRKSVQKRGWVQRGVDLTIDFKIVVVKPSLENVTLIPFPMIMNTRILFQTQITFVKSQANE